MPVGKGKAKKRKTMCEVSGFLLCDACSKANEEKLKSKKDLSIALIDYRKTFDSIPHSWIKEVMAIYKIPSEPRLEYVIYDQCHLLYMDDLKLFIRNDDQLKKALIILNNFSRDIQMKFGLDKCATLIRKVAVVRSSGINVDQDIHFRGVDAEETYRYLRMEEAEVVQQQMMKEQFKKK
ncbi:hypothetical protein HELRODRAFT_182637 [Helobdella robusta]|uniref:Reverse transcriptase domain-containing protein n=1 Tax=Helobdella robusta TaxID=6412 RepID=T1FII8_HELRO|nr:hypothetical protein HELRODRAFT_182637 [Helobdella robusta]ESN90805.1 hypothetical protein HELRODRAFT_182637 [Helobdella robusta]